MPTIPHDNTSDPQHPAVEGLIKKSMAARWASDREALGNAVPDVIFGMAKDGKVIYSARSWRESNPKIFAHELETALQAFWPVDALPQELANGREMSQFEGVIAIDIIHRDFTRRFEVMPKSTLINCEDHETSGNEDDGQDQTDTFTNVCLITPKVAVYSSMVRRPFCDESFDAEFEGAVYISEDPKQMQRLMRHLVQSHFRNPEVVVGYPTLEEQLRGCYRTRYSPPEKSLTPKP